MHKRKHDFSDILFEEDRSLAPGEQDVKAIAFYLPQFYPIPENDRWWGKGFTEWRNVTKAQPQFIGHPQPKLPYELGFYDLRLVEIQAQQIALAKQHGIYGFCFHHYWFAGKRLLERPVDQLLEHPELDMPFCLCWANENWTRRWDGEEQAVLMAQQYSPQADLAFIADLSRYLRDPRYIRVDGKPLIIVYRVTLLPDPKATAARWRRYCHENGIGDLHLVAAQSFDINTDPARWDFDAAVEFPPHMPVLEHIRVSKDTTADFSGYIYSYKGLADWFMAKPVPDFELYKTACPAWDNTARKNNTAAIFADSSPDIYADWLGVACEHAHRNLPPDRRFVFVNAWNEWAEGAYLEPDMAYGYAYLNRTAAILWQQANPMLAPFKLLVVSHDTNVAGAQMLLLHLLRWLKRHTHIDVRVAALCSGNIREVFEEIGPLLVLDEAGSPQEQERLVYDFCDGRPDVILCNSVVTGLLHQQARFQGIPVVTYVHEMQKSIERFSTPEIFETTKSRTCKFLSASPLITANLIDNHAIPAENIDARYAFICPAIEEEDLSGKAAAREKFGIPQEAFVVFGCGSLDWRKGPDIFCQVAHIIARRGQGDFRFYWLGAPSGEDVDALLAGHLTGPAGERLAFLGHKDNPREFLLAGDLFLLPSREDPFPLAALEAAECALPIVCFGGCGGMPEFVGNTIGCTVPKLDAMGMAEACLQLWADEELRVKLGAAARRKVLDNQVVGKIGPAIVHSCRMAANRPPAVSVIVPNYNYAHYLEGRIESILNQTFQDIEIILLDDASSDGSLDILSRYAGLAHVRVVANTQNSGGTFCQWRKGLELARSNLIWIAEADDLCEPTLLERLLPAFADPAVVMAYCASRVIDEHGVDNGVDYRTDPYLADLSQDRWFHDYVVDGQEEIMAGMAIKNTILNVSSVVFRRPNMEHVSEAASYSFSGDWFFYLCMLQYGKISYTADALNAHRRHNSSVASASNSRFHLLMTELMRIHKHVLQEFDVSFQTAKRMTSYVAGPILGMFPNKTPDDMLDLYDAPHLMQIFKKRSFLSG